jgi:lipopolysaccharide assembly outer membrane protein LptD (OstA)
MPFTLRVLTAGILFCAAWTVLPPVASSQDISLFEDDRDSLRREGAQLTADVLEYESTRDVYTARGHVVIHQGDRILKADWIVFHPETGAGVASGNVEVIDSDQTLRADFVQFDTESLQGLVRNAWLDSPVSQFRTVGKTIEKTGENTYRFEDGVFTTCRCPEEDRPEPWRLRAREAEIEINGYGTLRDARFEVFGVPILWLPWMMYPIKTERQTGFLFPEISTASRNGFVVGLPFFWAPRDDFQATVTPHWSEKRGFKGDVGLEYLVGSRSEGDLFGAFTSDQEIDPRTLDEPFRRRRWGVRGDQDFALPFGVRAQAEFRFASDNQYPLDYDDLQVARATRYLESTAFVSRGFGATGRLGTVAAVHFADDFQNPDDLDRDEVLLQRMPSVDLAWLPGAAPWLSWLKPSLDVDYTWFDSRDAPPGTGAFLDFGVDGVANADEREQGPGLAGDRHADNFSLATNPTGTEGDGIFQEGEALRDDGHRVILHPKLAVPLRLGRFLELLPEAGYQQTLYSSRLEGGDGDGRFTARVDLRTRLRRRFGDVVHRIEPVVGYAFVDATSRGGRPLFVPGTALPQERIRALALENVVDDSADRVAQAHELTFGLAQRAFQVGGADSPRVSADLSILGRYDFEAHDFSDVVFDGRLKPRNLGRVRFNLGLDPDAVRVNEALAEWTWDHADGHSVAFDYRFLRDTPEIFEDFGTGDRFDDSEDANRVDQIGSSLRLVLTRNWSLAYRASWSFATDLLLANEGSVEYLSSCGCWAAGLEFTDDRARGVEVKVLYRLIGLGNDERANPRGLLDALGGL